MTPDLGAPYSSAVAWLYLGWIAVFLAAVFIGYLKATRNDHLGRKRHDRD